MKQLLAGSLKLEQHVIWAGKYTVPMSTGVLYNEAQMNVLRTSSVIDELMLVEPIIGRLFEKISPSVS
jgi:hypothetical protein